MLCSNILSVGRACGKECSLADSSEVSCKSTIADNKSSHTHNRNWCQAAYYLFTNTSDNRFVIGSGESRLNELVGYGTLSSANGTKPVSEEFKGLLRRYEHVVAAVRTGKAQVPTVRLPEKQEVQPLLTSHWEQNYPFNQYTLRQSGVNTPTESKK